MNDKIKKAIELLRYARSLPPNDAGGYEDNLQWGKDVDALLRSISPEVEGRIVHQCQICEREVSIPQERVHNTMYAPVCCDWPMHKIHPQTEEPTPTPSPEAVCPKCCDEIDRLEDENDKEKLRNEHAGGLNKVLVNNAQIQLNEVNRLKADIAGLKNGVAFGKELYSEMKASIDTLKAENKRLTESK